MMAKTETAQVTMPSDGEVKVVRSFDAPRGLVYRAYTSPELVKRWMLGPPGWTMPVCEMDVREGGSYRWRWRSTENNAEFGFFGEFLEVDEPNRLRHTESYDPGDVGGEMGDQPAIVTVSFDERDGVTTLTTLMDFGSRASRDQAMATGMTEGMEATYKRLDELLAEASTR